MVICVFYSFYWRCWHLIVVAADGGVIGGVGIVAFVGGQWRFC